MASDRSIHPRHSSYSLRFSLYVVILAITTTTLSTLLRTYDLVMHKVPDFAWKWTDKCKVKDPLSSRYSNTLEIAINFIEMHPFYHYALILHYFATA